MRERLVVSLIGMSGSGKTYWSKKLEGKGVERFGCDDLIEAELDPELKQLGYAGGIKEVAKWMGQPFDPQYGRTSQRYLALEEEVVGKVLTSIEQFRSCQNIVVDTTGSVIYLPAAILERLAAITHIVYLDTPDTVKEEKYQQYLADPKPVIWGDSFFRIEGETNMEALARCYPDLLAYRSKRYVKLADITLDYHALRSPGFTVDRFIQLISK